MATYEDLAKEQLINDLIKLSQRINELGKIKDQHEKTYEELVRTKAMYHGLFEFAPDAIVVANLDGHLVQVNAQAERLFGYGRDEMLEKPVEILMPERFKQRHIEHRQSYFDRPHVRPMGMGLELYGKRKDGSEFPLDISLGPLEIEKDIFVVSVVRDISRRKQTEEELKTTRDQLEARVHQRTQELEAINEGLKTEIEKCQKIEDKLRESEGYLRHLSTEFLTAQEKDRRVAQEIHDSVGSPLAATKFRVEDALGQVGDSNPQARAHLESVIPILQEKIEETRRIQMALRPSILDDLGILATIQWFCRQFESTYKHIRIKQEIDIREDEVVDPLKIAIFRVLQEATNNIAKHSKADVVRLSLRRMDGRIELVLKDNGRGFNLGKVFASESTKRGLGLTSMRERIELLRGSFGIETGEGKGTIIRASWPC